MLGAMLIAMVVAMALFVGLVYAAMWVSRRWLTAWVSVGIAGLAATYLGQSIIRGVIHCSQPPTFIPPAPGSDGEGQMLFNCDSAGGLLDRIYIYVLGPMALLAVLWLALRFWPRNASPAKATHQ